MSTKQELIELLGDDLAQQVLDKAETKTDELKAKVRFKSTGGPTVKLILSPEARAKYIEAEAVRQKSLKAVESVRSHFDNPIFKSQKAQDFNASRTVLDLREPEADPEPAPKRVSPFARFYENAAVARGKSLAEAGYDFAAALIGESAAAILRR